MTPTDIQTATEHKTVYKVCTADSEQTFDSRSQAADHVVEQLHNAAAALQANGDTDLHGAVSWSTEQVPAGHLDELLSIYSDGEVNPDWELDRTCRYLLVERSRYDGSHWLSSHASMANAADYHDGQEYPEDWNIVGLYDLETGRKLDAHQVTRFEK